MKKYRIYTMITSVIEADNFDDAEAKTKKAVRKASRTLYDDGIILELIDVDGMDEI